MIGWPPSRGGGGLAAGGGAWPYRMRVAVTAPPGEPLPP